MPILVTMASPHPPSETADVTALILDTAHEAFVSADCDGRIIAWNAAAELIFGWTRAEVIGRSLDDVLIPPAYREAHRAGMARYLATGEGRAINRRLELEAIDRDGRVFPVEITLSPLRVGESLTFHAFLHDISERRAAEAGSRRLAAIVEGSRDAIIVCDADGVITDWNPAAERLHGWPAQDMVGEHMRTLVAPGHEDGLLRAAQRAMGGEVVDGLEAAHRCADGGCVAVEVRISPLHGDEGGLLGLSVIARDISERVRARDELAAHTQRLQRLEHDHRRTTADPASTAAANDLQSTVEQVLGVVREQLDMDVAWLAEFVDGQMVFRALEGEEGFFGAGVGEGIALEGTYCQRVVDGRIAPIVHDAPTHAEVRDLTVTRAAGMGSYIGVPIRLGDGELYGTLCAASHEPDPTLAERDVRFLHVLAALLSGQLAAHRDQAEKGRVTAELTGISALLAALEARDHYTGEHSQAVVELSRAVAERLGLAARAIAEVEQVALLHDLGKVGIPDPVLQKPGPLTDAEWVLMREHPAIGARIVASVASLAHLAPAVRAEHERFDGHGSRTVCNASRFPSPQGSRWPAMPFTP